MKITNYTILSSETYSDLAQQVRNMLKEGWQPYGGLQTTSSYATNINRIFSKYSQAVVKYENSTAQEPNNTINAPQYGTIKYVG